MKIICKRVVAVFLSFFMLFSIFNNVNTVSVSAETAPLSMNSDTYVEEISGTTYQKVAQNEKFTMFVDQTGQFCILVNATGYVWYSHPIDESNDKTTIGINKQNIYSEVVVNYVYKDDGTNTASYSESSVSGKSAVRAGNVKVEKIENGIKTVYDFFAIGARVTVTFTLDQDGLVAKVIGKETLERSDFLEAVKNTASKEELDLIQDSYITSIWLLPSFGVGNQNEQGFVFVPDGSGAYMDYVPSSSTTEFINVPVYGKELAIDDGGLNKENFSSETKDFKANLPMFAIAREKEGFVATIEQGDAISSINAFKAGKANAYTGVSSQVDYRHVTYSSIGSRVVQNVSNFADVLADFEVRYNFITDENISFSKLADVYRDLLESKSLIVKQQYSPSLALQVVGAIDVDSHFLGIPCKKIKSLTTFEQCEDIISDLKNEGIKNISINYLGWLNNGIQNSKTIKKAVPLKQLGGKDGLNELADSVSQNDSIYLDADIQTFKKSGNGISKNSNSSKTPFDKVAKQRKFTLSLFDFLDTDVRLLSPQKLNFVSDRYINSTKNLPDNVSLSFNSASANCYSDFDSNEVKTRIDTVNSYREMFSKIEEPMSSQNANMYTLKYVNRVFNAPNSSSRQKIYDGELPFYQMVLHGYVSLTSYKINQSGSHHTAYLRAVETGSELNFLIMKEDSGVVNGTDYDYLFGSTYDYVSNDIISMYKEYYQLYKKIYDKIITDYIMYTPFVTETVYENGISVYVNYTDSEYTLENGTVVPANGFCYKEAK